MSATFSAALKMGKVYNVCPAVHDTKSGSKV